MMEKDKELKRELNIFMGSKNGKTASTESGNSYRVKGSYLDSNGCMRTYGDYRDSFIRETKYE